MVEHFTCFTKKKEANYWLKTQQEQQEDNSMDDICYLENINFAVLNNPLNPRLANKWDIELNIDGGKHVLACFSTRNYFE